MLAQASMTFHRQISCLVLTIKSLLPVSRWIGAWQPRLRRALPWAATLTLVAGPSLFLCNYATAQAGLVRLNLSLVCTGTAASEPQLKDRNSGSLYPITDPQLKAVAAGVCNSPLFGGSSTTVNIVNSRGTPIFVGFTTINHQPGPINWGPGCILSGKGAQIAAGATCTATVASTGVASRFCATTTQVPADCFNAQANHQTMVETNFEPASNPGCFNKGNCVWFDISVIPSTCTDALWQQDQCANAGGASYNLPVQLSCNNALVYTCQGPQNTTYGAANYPSNCGNPNATCQSSPNCQNAYFYPMFDPPENAYQPNTVCLGGQALTVTFLSGQ